jgi:hypothetical protein
MAARRAYTQWTADTEIAFVMALRFHGRATLAAAELGKTVAGAYLRRKRCPDFAAKWEAALDEWRRRNAAVLAPPAADADDLPMVEHFDGFTKQRRRAFLRKLTETGDVEAACRYVRLTPSGAYQLRRNHPAFRDAWDRALAMSVATLEQAAVERGLVGVEEPVWHAGKIVGYRMRQSDTLLKLMIQRGDRREGADRTKQELIEEARTAARLAGGRFATEQGSEEAFASLAHKLDRIASHRRRQEAARAEQWLAEGKIP